MNADGEIFIDIIANEEGVFSAFDATIERVNAAIAGLERLKATANGTEAATRAIASAMGDVATNTQKAVGEFNGSFKSWVAEMRKERAQSRASAAAPTSTRMSHLDAAAIAAGVEASAVDASARVAQAAENAARRMTAKVEEAMTAAFRRAQINMEKLQLRYGSAEAADLQWRSAIIAEGKRRVQIGGAQTYEDVLAAESARALERQRMAALQKQMKAEESAAKSLERQRMSALQRQMAAEQDAVRSLERQRMAAQGHAALEEYRLATDPVYRLSQERRARLASQIGDKSLEEFEAARTAKKSSFGSDLQSSLVGVVGAGFALNGIASTVHAVTELDDALKRFQAITGSSNETTAQLKEQMFGLASGSRVAVKELADVATTLGQTGLSAREVATALPAVVNLAVSSGASLHQATEVLTATLGAYNQEATRTADLANIMSGALSNTRLNIEQLSFGLQYAADIAAQVGVSITELTSVFGGLAQAGIRSGSTIGTGVRLLLRELESPTPRFRAEMERLGITLADIDVKTNTLTGVLDNLKAKGFDTAAAMRSLETRGVSAYAALQVQSGTIKRLQEELLLYNGAADGARVANESLTARLTQAGNAMLAVTDHAAAPLVEAMKGAASGLSFLSDSALKLGPALPAVGIGVSSVAAGLTAIKAAQVGQSLATIAQGFLSVGVAAEGATLAFGPLGVMVGALTAAGLGVAYLANSSASGADKIDRLKTSMQELDSRIQQGAVSSQQIDKSIDELILKREKLNADPLLRRNAIIEAQKAFADLGLTVKANAGSIDELVDALRRLRSEMAQDAAKPIILRLSETAKFLDELRKGAKTGERDSRDKLADAFLSSSGPLSARGPGQVRRAITVQLGEEFGAVATLAQNWGRLPEGDVRSATGPALGLLFRKAEALRNERVNATPARGAELDKLLEKLGTLEAEVRKAQEWASNLQSNRLAMDRLRLASQVEGVRATPAYQRLLALKENAKGDFEAEIQRISGDTSGTPAARVAAIEAAKARAKDASGDALRQVEAEMKRLAERGTSADAIKQAFGDMTDSLKNLTALANSAEADANKLRAKLEAPRLEQQRREMQAKISAALSRLKLSNDPADVGMVETQIAAFTEREKEIEQQLVTLKASNPEHLSDDEREKLASALREIDAHRERYSETLLAERQRMAERIFGVQERNLQARKREVDEQIAGLEKEIRSPQTTADKIAELRRKLDELIDQRVRLVEEEINSKYQRDRLTLPKAFVPTDAASVGSVQRGIIDAATAAGRSDMIPFLLRLGEKESGFDPSSEKGLFQFMPDTWKRYGASGNVTSVSDQVSAAFRYLADAQAQFTKAFGRAPSDQETYTLWQQGSAGALALMKNRQANAVDALTPAYGGNQAAARKAVTGNGGTADMTAQQFLDYIAEYFGSTAGTRRYAVGTDQTLEDQRRADLRRNEQEAKDRRAENDRVEAMRRYKDRKADDTLAGQGDEQRIKTLLAGARDEYASPAEAVRDASEIARLRRERATKELALFDAQPINDTESGKEREVGRSSTKAKSTSEFLSSLQQGAEAIEASALAADKRRLKELQAQHKALADSDKANPQELFRLEKETEAVQKRVRFEDELNGKRAALKFLEDQIAAAQKDGALDQSRLTDLAQTELGLKRRIAELERELAQYEELKKRPDDPLAGVANGSRSFFEQQGMLGKDGKWQTTTQQIAQSWSGVLGGMEQASTQFFTNWASGTMNAGKAFQQFGVSILGTMEQIVAKALSQQILKSLFGGMVDGSGKDGAGLLGSIGGLFSGMATGGLVRAATGLYNPNRDSVPTLLMPGEYVLRQSAVNAVGRDKLDALNALGNARISQSAPAPLPASTMKPATPVNVWVAAPDQVPPPGPNDIVHHIANNIQQGGQIKALIKQVNLGAV
ncbi:TP901 family phage tail tape measure protein [Rhodoblastus acidophilus]|uniref:phage tail tape measure protein n=1 Tax=Rhodoblastus acidophilus TaxID=1074 RepID=UPI0022247853|nr:phage tail tape measure protein [Rhodoblastus acidophilus]MCW2284708.1 TP901 family phage tail tape measure protein [Rhodoblastus acidophilus]MCW2333661.1 TP901 family phage tail tape measure protein [Rhodoblastus acidophilus]